MTTELITPAGHRQSVYVSDDPPTSASHRYARTNASLSLKEWFKGFLGGTGSGLFVQIIGYLSLLEVWLVLTFPITAGRFIRNATAPGVRTFTALWILWILGQLFSDVVNQNQFSLAARGFARAFFAGYVTIYLLPVMMRRPRLYEAFLAGIPIAHIIATRYFRPGTYLSQDGSRMLDASQLGWENWTSYLVTTILIYGVARLWRVTPWMCVAATASVGVLNIANGSRSTGLIYILAAMLMPLFISVTRDTRKAEATRWKWLQHMQWGTVILIFILGAGTTLGVAEAYKSLASSGALGKKAFDKYVSQSESGNLLIGARQGTFIGIAAALDKPFAGHGSWPRAKKDYIEDATRLFGVEFKVDKGFSLMNQFIPAHSMLIGGWVESGIFGLIFWIYVVLLVVRNSRSAAIYFHEYAGVILINGIGFFWNVMFSPIQNRSYTATIVIPLLISQIRRLQQQSAVSSQQAVTGHADDGGSLLGRGGARPNR